MAKRMIIMLVVVAIVFGGIFGWDLFKAHMVAKYMANMPVPSQAVTAQKATVATWNPELHSVASLRAVQGVDVTTEVAGIVKQIKFKSGDEIKAGTVLVQLEADADNAKLRGLQAQVKLAQINYDRDRGLLARRIASQAQVDTDRSQLDNARAQADQQAALVAKKTIRAPFSGRLGIRQIDVGQYLAAGANIVTLQALDPLYADFSLPQQDLSKTRVGQPITLTTNAFPDVKFEGKITAINPKVDPGTRNFAVEASLANPDHKLAPGMFGTVAVELPQQQNVITLPQTAITYNPYGDTVYVIEDKGKDGKGNPKLIAQQRFVTTGETRGDQVEIEKGVKVGDQVVTSGQIKLRNGSPVTINNKVQPTNNPAPMPADKS
jgi:membrane fusion protein (multidrug efflux system)